MKARDVLEKEWRGVGGRIQDHLLAQTPEGEGVYIAPDGTLMRLMRWGPVPIEEATDD